MTMENIHYVDSHAHLMGEEFEKDLDTVLEKTKARRVDRIMIITLKEEEARRAKAFVQSQEGKGIDFRIATAIFPDEAGTYTEDDYARFEAMAGDPMITAVGEIGLDYHWEKDPVIQEKQRQLFIRQIETAKKLNKPILVHSRDAIQDTFDILREHRVHGLIHCYSGTKEMAREFVKQGYYIALGGAVTFKNSRHAKEVAADIDVNYLLSETDCPYMAPEPVRGTRNDPSNIPYIVDVLAKCRNITVEEMASQIDANWIRFLEGR